MKTTIDGFHKTELENYLHLLGVDTIVCIGMLTCCCVHQTAIGGMLRGFVPIVVEDLCIDKNNEKHQATFYLYKDYMYQTCQFSDIVELLKPST